MRAAGRAIPGLAPLYHPLAQRLILWRGVAALDYTREKVIVRADSRATVPMRLYPAAKEPWTVRWLEENVRPDDVLWDVGANIGAYALIGAKLGRGTTVVAIEPGYATFAALCDNVVLNRLGDAIVPLPVVLGDTTGRGTLGYHDTAAGAALHALDSARASVYRQPVLIHTLDDLVARFDLPPPTLLKLDVDGAEGSVLAGAPETLRRPELRSAIVEVEAAQTEAVTSRLAAAGLELVERHDDRDGRPLPGIWYGIFSRSSARS